MLAPLNHNNPPGCIEDAGNALADLSRFLEANPVIENEEQARQGKLHVDRTRATLGALEDERDAKVRPLNETVRSINAEYKAASVPLAKVLDELRNRLTAFAKAEEDRRNREAEAARLAAFEAERAAREAEERERELKDSATFGEVVNVAAAVVEADRAFAEFEQRTREADRAERDSHVKIGGGFSGRALSLKTTETLHVTDAAQAIEAMGLTASIQEAVISSARTYRKLKGTLPPGVSATTDRRI